MLSGIFWLDDAPGRPLEQTVAQAASSYRSRFHREPTLCLVPTGLLHAPMSRLGQLRVREHAALPPHQIWIGVEDSRRALYGSLSLNLGSRPGTADSVPVHTLPPQAFRRHRSRPRSPRR